MKKKFLSLLILISLTSFGFSQNSEIELSVIGSGGSYMETEGRVLHSSIGETIVSYGESENGRVLQSGFLQNLNSQPIDVENEEEEKACTIDLEPIIAIDEENGLRWNNLPSNSGYNLTVFHRNGNILHQEEYNRSNPYTGDNLKAGSYLYVISNAFDKSCLNSAVTVVR